MTDIFTRENAIDDEGWNDNIEGESIGSSVSIILEYAEVVGSGPRLHKHPYEETFLIRRGSARFTIGDAVIEAHGGQVLVAPANTPHRFEVLGPGPYVATHIHANPRFITEWLE